MAWPIYVEEVFAYRGNGNGELGNHNMLNNGAGPTYQNEGDAKIGTQTLSVQAAHNTLKFPPGLIAYLAGKNQWTIEQWVKFAAGNNPNFWQIVWAVPWSNWGNNTFAWLQNNTNGNYEWTMNLSHVPGNNAFVPGWRFTSLQWDGVLNQGKFFLDGVQIGATHNTALNPFNGIAVDVKIIDGLFGDTYHRDMRADKLIISDVLRNGVETVELPGIASGFSKDSFAGSSISKGGFR